MATARDITLDLSSDCEVELHAWIRDYERRHFRTPFDTGANLNAMIVWNGLRTAAGLPELTQVDLLRRQFSTYAEDVADAAREGHVEHLERALRSYREIQAILLAPDPERSLEEYRDRLRALQHGGPQAQIVLAERDVDRAGAAVAEALTAQRAAQERLNDLISKP